MCREVRDQLENSSRDKACYTQMCVFDVVVQQENIDSLSKDSVVADMEMDEEEKKENADKYQI